MDEYPDEFNDAADDWEAEADAEEAREKMLLEQKAFLEEKKLIKRVKAPSRAKREEEEEEALEVDVTQALCEMRSMAGSAAEALHLIKETESTPSIIADMPVDTIEGAKALGFTIADRLLTFAESPHFSAILSVVFQDIAREFKPDKILDIEGMVTRMGKGCRPQMKKGKFTKEGHGDDKANHDTLEGVQAGDALGLDNVNDEGGAACVPDAEADFM